MTDSAPPSPQPQPTAFRAWRQFTPLVDPNTIPRGPVLVFAPHPDDEIIGCGGALALHAARGDPVHVLQLTGGERGDPRGLETGELVSVRLAESRAAAAILGIHETVGLAFMDGSLKPEPALIDRLVDEIHRVTPVVAYAPSPLECHPDHLAASWAAAAALARSALIVRLFGFEVNHPTLASFLLDITPHIDQKRDALAQFRSQLRYTDVVGKCLAGAYARTVNIDLPAVQYAEAFMEIEPAKLPELWGELEAFCRRYRLP